MNKMNFHRLIFPFFFLFAAQITHAQGGATIKATVNKNRILIGEPFVLTVEANLSPESVISFIDIDTIDHFELLEKPFTDTISTNGGTTIKGVYKITSFDSGHWVIPSFVLSASVKTDTIPVDVVFSDFNPNQDYHDIKDIIEVTPDAKKQWWWYAAGGALLLLLVLIYLFRKKKKPSVTPVVQIINPYEEAMKQLELLQRENFLAKQYYSGLVDVFRLYIFRKKGILSLQKTTDDLILQLKNVGLDKEQFAQLSQALRLSDFVKFAKYAPVIEDNRIVFETIKNSIRVIEQTN